MKAWPTERIGDACTIFSGGTPSKANPNYWRGAIPWVTAKDLKADRICDAELHITQQACDESATKIAPAGALLMLVRGMGLANGMQIGEVTSPVAFNQDIRAVIPPARIESRFLLLALRHCLANDGAGVLSSAAHGTLKIDSDALRQVAVPVPPLSEQRRIVAILDEAFEGIATAKAHAERNLRNAREVFERQLQATFDPKVASWPVYRLGTLCTQVTDGTHNSPAYVEMGVPMLDSKHIGDGFEIDDSRAEKFIAPDVDAQLAQRCKPSEGDILISSRGTIGKIAIVKAGQDFNIMGNMILLRFPSSVDRHFIAFYVLSRVAHIESIARGVAQKGLYLGQVRDYEVPVPSLDEQRRIGKRLQCLQTEAARLCEVMKRKLATLDELKQSLLHRAFGGAL